MKDVDKLFAECESDLAQLGYHPRNYVIEVNTRAKRRWGQCKIVTNDYYIIQITDRLLADDVADIAAKNTIMHELIHAVRGCSDHTGKWKQIAEMVNRQFPKYTIKRCTTAEEKGIAPVEQVRRASSTQYCIQCQNCGNKIIRERMSKVVQHPERYICAHCCGPLKRLY